VCLFVTERERQKERETERERQKEREPHPVSFLSASCGGTKSTAVTAAPISLKRAKRYERGRPFGSLAATGMVTMLLRSTY